MRLCFAFGVCAVAFEPRAFAQSPKEILKSPLWAKGMVATDGGPVYEKPDFDAPVKEYLGFKTKIWILKKAVAGRGGMGLFHRVRYKTKSGYMADTDIRFSGKEIEKEKERVSDVTESGGKAVKKRSKAWEEEDQIAMGAQPIYFTRYIGGALARVNVSEKFSGKKLSDQMLMAGLRMTGPGVLFDGPPIDFNLWFTMQKPGYYDRLGAEAAKGFMFFGDIAPILPIYDARNTLLYFNLGVMWTYSSYKVTIKQSTFDSQEFRLGFDFGLGTAFKFGRMVARADAKYYWEKTQYLGLMLSLQTEY